MKGILTVILLATAFASYAEKFHGRAERVQPKVPTENKKNLRKMGNSDSKLNFRKAVIQLTTKTQVRDPKQYSALDTYFYYES